MEEIRDPCPNKIPQVITDEFLHKKLLEVSKNSEDERLAKQEGALLHKAEVIFLDYANILKMDHLWVLKRLKKLILNNNWIDKIENIDMLVNLTHLNLSFNKISKIENLENLVNLEQLSLFDNRISVIENLDTLKKLSIFSIGRNLLTEKSNVLYLRRLKSLKALNMAENPIAYDENFRIYIAAFMPNLVYYEYRKLSELEREVGIESFREEYDIIERQDSVENEKIAEAEKGKAELELHTKCFVENLNNRTLIDSLFEDDAEGKIILQIPDEIPGIHTEFEENFVKECLVVFEMGREQYAIRQNEIDQFNKCVEKAKMENQKQSIVNSNSNLFVAMIRFSLHKEIMENFIIEKDQIFEDVRYAQEEFTYTQTLDSYTCAVQEQSEKFFKVCHSAWKSLMKLELELFEQILDVTDTFERVLTELINTFIEDAQGQFSKIRELETEYCDSVAEVAKRFQVFYNLSEVPPAMSPELREMMIDKDALVNALNSSRDSHSLQIDIREDILVSHAKEWLETTIDHLQKQEIERNRDKINEISHFMGKQRKAFDILANSLLDSQEFTLSLID